MAKRVRSLRWRMQFWYSCVLLAVLVGYGWYLFRTVQRSHWNRVDDELIAAARSVEGAYRNHRSVRGPRGGGLGRGPETSRLPSNAPGGQDGKGREPPPQRNPMQLEPPPGDEGFRLPRPLPTGWSPDNGPTYYLIWREDGSILRQEDVPLDAPKLLDLSGQQGYSPFAIRDRGPFREVYLKGPEGTTICVGRSVTAERGFVTRMAIQLLTTGGFILIAGVAGGWWLAHQAILPIERMSDTVSTIYAESLGRRLDLDGMDLELQRLGAKINEMLSRLDEAFSQQKRFTADASHELRTPLTTILNNVELALSRPRSTEEYRDYLLRCQRAAERMNHLASGLLILARLDEDPYERTKQACDLSSIAREAVQCLAVLAEQKRIAIQLEAHPAPLMGVPDQLFQVASNLIQNAIQHSDEGSKIEVSVRETETNAELCVRDYGKGISQEHLPYLFDRFYRADAARAGKDGGSGLGLAICKRIVDLHHGQIDILTEGENGTQFRVRLPRKAPSSL